MAENSNWEIFFNCDLQIAGYSRFIGRSNTTSNNKFNKPEEELNLTLKFENVSSKLPPKLQLEICDSDSGKVVFQKRQNIYYIKLQEKLASLDCDKNYVLKVTSIKDNVTSDGVVEIHKKDIGKSQSKKKITQFSKFVSFANFFLRKKYVGLRSILFVFCKFLKDLKKLSLRKSN